LHELQFAFYDFTLLFQITHQLMKLLDGPFLTSGSEAFWDLARSSLDLCRLGGEGLEVVVQNVILSLSRRQKKSSTMSVVQRSEKE